MPNHVSRARTRPTGSFSLLTNVGLNNMKADERPKIVTHPNWAHLMACCAFVAPISVAVVTLYHDSLALFSGCPWHYLKGSLIVHPIVIVASLLAFAFMTLRWREFYTLPPVRQKLVAFGCWLVLFEAFAFCMVITSDFLISTGKRC